MIDYILLIFVIIFLYEFYLIINLEKVFKQILKISKLYLKLIGKNNYYLLSKQISFYRFAYILLFNSFKIILFIILIIIFTFIFNLISKSFISFLFEIKNVILSFFIFYVYLRIRKIISDLKNEI